MIKLLKILLVSSLVIIPGAYSQDSESNDNFTNWFGRQGLGTILKTRCLTYLYFDYNLLKNCYSSASSLVHSLDFYQADINDHGGGIFFVTDLEELWKNPKTHQFFIILRDKLIEHHQGLIDEVDIWEETLEFWGNKKDATKFLAVFFQGTSRNILIEYLAMFHEELLTKNNVNTFREVFGFFDPETIASGQYNITFYPKDAGNQKELGPLVYYFYANAYLAMNMGNEKFRRIMPVIMSALYKYKKFMGRSVWLLDPDEIDINKYIFSLTSIYSSYVATHWQEGFCVKLDSRKTFINALSKMPTEYMRLLLLRQ